MELANNINALLDKVYIYNFAVTEIADFQSLIDSNILTVKERTENHITTIGGERYDHICIKDDPEFDFFYFGVKKSGGAYGKLELSILDEDGYHNLNCGTPDYYRNRVIAVQKRLFEEYGISAEFCDCKYEKIEINRTFQLDHIFYEYHRPLSLMTFLFPPQLRIKVSNQNYDKDNPSAQIEDFIRKTGGITKSSGETGLDIKAYDKTRQLQEEYNITLSHNFMRFEITLKSQEKIKKELTTNKLFLLQDTDLDNYFDQFVEKNIITPYQQFRKKQTKYVQMILQEKYIPGNHTWINNLIHALCNFEIDNGGIPLILDMYDVLPMFDALDFKSAQIKCNAKRKFRTICKEQLPAFARHDSAKYQELLQKLYKHAS